MVAKYVNLMSQNQAFTEIINKIDNLVNIGMMWNDNELSLTGTAGTGKTYLTSKLVKELQSKYHITITAPTHKALQVLKKTLIDNNVNMVSAQTIQSFLNIQLVTDYDKGIQKFLPIKSKMTEEYKTDILIVDESSMVSYEVYQYIKEAIAKDRVKVVLFVGDKYQLLPIDNHNNKIYTILNSYKLNKIVRQAQDSYIINMATKAKEIIKSKKYISINEFFSDETFKHKVQFFHTQEEFHDDFCTPETWAKKDKIIAGFKNKSIDKHNHTIRTNFWREQNVIDAPTFRKGDKVIFQNANILEKDGKEILIHQNSEIVEIASAKKGFLDKANIYYWSCIDINGKPFKVVAPESQETFELFLNKASKNAKNEKDSIQRRKKWFFFFSTKRLFVDVKYTFASTIHKLQGSTYKTVYIDLIDIENIKDKDLMYRLLYVAITRASEEIKVLLPNDENNLLGSYQNDILNSLNNFFIE